MIVLDREGNIVQEQSETKRHRLLEANKVNIPQYSRTKQTSYLYPKNYATEPGTTCSDESTTVSSSVHAFFKQTRHLTQRTLETTKVATARTSDPKEPQVQEEAQHVTLAAKPQGNTLQPLPLPHHPELTRSQLIFSIATSIDPRSLAIERKDEFFLFMEMHTEHQWASFSMTCRKWVTATNSVNTQLQEQKKGETLEIVRKNPCVLMDKLAEVKQQIIQRFTTGNFTCK